MTQVGQSGGYISDAMMEGLMNRMSLFFTSSAFIICLALAQEERLTFKTEVVVNKATLIVQYQHRDFVLLQNTHSYYPFRNQSRPWEWCQIADEYQNYDLLVLIFICSQRPTTSQVNLLVSKVMTDGADIISVIVDCASDGSYNYILDEPVNHADDISAGCWNVNVSLQTSSQAAGFNIKPVASDIAPASAVSIIRDVHRTPSIRIFLVANLYVDEPGDKNHPMVLDNVDGMLVDENSVLTNVLDDTLLMPEDVSDLATGGQCTHSLDFLANFTLLVFLVLRQTGLEHPPCVLQDQNTTFLTGLWYLAIEDSPGLTLPDSPLLPEHNQLQELSLARNGLAKIEVTHLRHMIYLNLLDLSGNDLVELPGDIFVDMANLELLKLSQNNLQVFDVDRLVSVPYLRELLLNDNDISSIVGVFSTTPLLEFLNLSSNSLHILNEHMFENCSHLTYLDLSHNLITSLGQSCFASIGVRYFLDLSHNQLSQMTDVNNALSINSSVRVLDLSSNHILEMPDYCLSNAVRLTSLIARNNFIRTISPVAFDSLPYLFYLVFTNNSMNELDSSFLHHMNQSRYNLFFSSNHVKHIVPLNGSFPSPVIDMLDVSFNEISSVMPGSLSHLLIKHLYLDNNHITRIFLDAINPCIIILSLGYNEITKLSLGRENYPNLVALNAVGNNMSHLMTDDIPNLPQIRDLDITSNNLAEVDTDICRKMPLLESVELAHNHLTAEGMFQTDLSIECSNLVSIDLAFNDITSVHHLYDGISYQLAEVITLSGNQLENLPPRLLLKSLVQTITRQIRLDQCNIKEVPPQLLYGLPALFLVNMSRNAIEEFPLFDYGLDDLPSDISANNIVPIKYIMLYNNPLKCSCRMRWLRENPLLQNYYLVDDCLDQVTGERQPFIKVPLDHFLCVDTSLLYCGDVCTCLSPGENVGPSYIDCSHRNLTSAPSPLPSTALQIHLENNNIINLDFGLQTGNMLTSALFLGHCGIISIAPHAFQQYGNLEILHLEYNRIEFLEWGIFSALIKLTELYLDHNQIQHIRSDILMREFESSIVYLTLHDNLLTSLSDSNKDNLASLSSLTNLTLAGNPWDCIENCEWVVWENWLTNVKIVQDIQNIRCDGSNLSILEFANNEEYKQCAVIQNLAVIGALSTVGVFGICAIVGLLLLYRYRRQAVVLFVNRWRPSWLPERPENDVPYDAYIVYSEYDDNARHWVVHSLLPRLEYPEETPRYKLFIPERNSLLGSSRVDGIISDIKQCKRSIFLVSEAWLIDEWLLFSFQVAHGLMTQHRNHHQVIVIMFDRTNFEVSQLDECIRTYLEMRQYLEIGRRLFWKELLYRMPTLPSQQHVQIMDHLNDSDFELEELNTINP